MRTLLKCLGCLCAIALLLPGLYLAAAFGLQCFPANAAVPAAQDHTAYVMSNGIHTDLVFPLTSSQFDWRTAFPPTDFATASAQARYIAIGWGNRAFYLNVEHFRDLGPGIAAQALLGGGKTLLHVYYLSDEEVRAHPSIYSLPLSQAQYQVLIDYVRTTAGGFPAQALVGRHYGDHDAFYEAQGAYSLVFTCNNWVGRGLRSAGVKVSRWTPLPSNVSHFLQPARATPGP